MKTLKILTMVLIVSVIGTSQGEAQIWKKIKDKTKSKVEDRVSEKISERIADAVVEKMDVQLKSPNNPYGSSVRSEKPDDLPDTYSFDWRFKMKIKNAGMDEEMLFDYYMTSDGNYIGYEMPEAEGMFMVMDGNIKSTISFIEQDENMMALTYSLPDDLSSDDDSELDDDDMVITDLPSKTILGYEAQGKQIETDESTVIIYYTDEIKMSFSGMFPSFKNNEKTPDYDYPKDMQNASVLYMEVTEKESGDTFTMEGIAIEEVNRTIKTGDYQFL